jgi:Cd2+/Zn2+-exporting ATPase
MQQSASFHISGLDCAEEVLVLRNALADQPGIDDLQFDILRARMVVLFDPQRISTQDIVRQVARTGMRATAWREGRDASDGASWAIPVARTALTAASGALCLAALAVHAAVSGSWPLALGLHDHGGADTGTWAPWPPWQAAVLYAASIVCGAWFVVPKACAAIRTLRADMNLLMMVAVAGALALGEWFEAATVAFLFSLALLLEQASMRRARRAIAALLDLAPATARCLVGDNGQVEVRPADAVPVGTRIAVRPGEKIPLDARVLEGTAHVNQAPITGESIPVLRLPGDEVFAGTICEDGSLTLQVTHRAADSTLARIVHMVEQAQARRSPSEQWVDRFARYYTPAMMVLAVLIAVAPPLLAGGLWSDWIYRALVLLVIACPCALVISTPVSIVSALTSAARQGVLIKGGRFLEACASLRAVAVDKTGTLTTGHPVVREVVAFDSLAPGDVLARAASLECHSQHPLARAILTHARHQGVEIRPAQDYRLLRGLGAEARDGGEPIWIGSHRLVHLRVEEPPDVHARALELEAAGYTVVAVGSGDRVCGLIALADELRPGTAEAFRALRFAGVRRVVMLTGDNEATARIVAQQAGIVEFRAELLPEEKVRAVEELRAEEGAVAMVGDGVNDAPALAAATVGIAMGTAGTDVAIETADVALMADDLTRLPWLVRHARRTLRIVQQNVAFALGLKALFVVLTLLGLASLWLAIAADTGASLLVVFNGLRLLRA